MQADEFAKRVTIGEITPLEGEYGFRVKETPTHYIDVVPMIYNFRLATTPKDSPLTYDRGWCYNGTGLNTLLRAIGAALEWDGADNTRPEGWIKDVVTGEHRAPPAGT